MLGVITLPLFGRVEIARQFRGGVNKKFHKIKYSIKSKYFHPSQNFRAENFTLPQGEGDCTKLEKGDCTKLDNGVCKELVENSKINF